MLQHGIGFSFLLLLFIQRTAIIPVDCLLLCPGKWHGKPLVSQGSSCQISCSGVCQIWGALLPDSAAHHAGTQLRIPADQQPSQHTLWCVLLAPHMFIMMGHYWHAWLKSWEHLKASLWVVAALHLVCMRHDQLQSITVNSCIRMMNVYSRGCFGGGWGGGIAGRSVLSTMQGT